MKLGCVLVIVWCSVGLVGLVGVMIGMLCLVVMDVMLLN